jgi:hypothetical protein
LHIAIVSNIGSVEQLTKKSKNFCRISSDDIALHITKKPLKTKMSLGAQARQGARAGR